MLLSLDQELEAKIWNLRKFDHMGVFLVRCHICAPSYMFQSKNTRQPELDKITTHLGAVLATRASVSSEHCASANCIRNRGNVTLLAEQNHQIDPQETVNVRYHFR